MNAETRMTRARTRLLLNQPWFGSLAMRLDMQPAKCHTMETNGTVLRFNPEWVTKQTDADLLTIMAHEVLHCALLHPYRRGRRDAQRWNRACDYVVNLDLQAAGFQLPADSLIDPQYQGLSADVVYSQLAQDPDDQDGDTPSTGTVEDAPQQGQSAPSDGQGQQAGEQAGEGQGTPAEQPGDAPGPGQGMTEEDWKIASEQATAVTKAAGNTPGGAARSAKAARQQPEDWRAILREFIEHQTPSDYSWGTPNRRFIADGVYLPGVLKENLGYIAVAVDTSGSISGEVLAAFAQELTEIVHEARPDRVHVVYCDARVNGTEEFTPDDEAVTLRALGGGGTRFNPVFEHIESQDEAPAALLYFTDLENGGERLTEPAYPVLWVTGKNVTKPAPFGPVVRINAHDV